MSTRRLWAISGGAVAVVAMLVAVLLLTAAPPGPASTATPSAATERTPSPAVSTTPTPSRTAAPDPAPTPTAPAMPTCDSILTETYRAALASNGWQTWETTAVAPFDSFPDGPPAVRLVCRSGPSPDSGTDRAWARIAPENAVAAIQVLEASGFARDDTAEGVYLSAGSSAYLFTALDVRWATTRDDLAAIRPADELERRVESAP